jgi:hypothetical protein
VSRRLLVLTLSFASGLLGGCALGDDPKRAFSLPNDTGAWRLIHRCEAPDCRSLSDRELVRSGESLDFKLYYDEDRTYVVGDATGKTLGCLTVPLADGTSYYPESLSDLEQCPQGTPTST